MNFYNISPSFISSLKSNEVFVFGTNESGFHGGGAAGHAFRTKSGNWRHDEFFLDAMNSTEGSEKRIGKWAIYGQASGLMQGTSGKSYGIITIKRPGLKRSRPLVKIKKDVDELFEVAKKNPDLKFLVTEIGCNLAGYQVFEISQLFIEAYKYHNIYIPQSFADAIKQL